MNYTTRITQSLDELRQLEAQQKLARQRDPIRFLRLLKEGTASSQQQAGQTIGLALRQSQRIWKTYLLTGLDGLIQVPYQPALGKLSAHQLGQLQAWLRLDQAQTLEHIQTYLLQRWTISYTISGVSKLCKRLKIKLKTGRPVNRRQDPAGREAFKKTLRT